jgi:protein O-GlcNAc transferase
VKKIVSFSLWGDIPRYTEGAIRNAELALEVYPDWICRYYIGKNTPLGIIGRLSEFDNTEIYIMNEPGDWTGMFWRFYPASDLDVGVMISRDVDSRLTVREKAAVDEWLESDKDFHIMRDHPYHNTPILGGMWGVRNCLLLDMVEYINEYSKGDFWQVDQNFLRECVYSKVKDEAFVHDEYFEKNPFPIKRDDGCFVGQAFNENDEQLNPEHSEMLL